MRTAIETPNQVGTRRPSGWYLIGCLPTTKILSNINVDREAFVIGRAPEAELPIPSSCVSGRHAELLTIGDSLFIRDLGSTNGTYLNRKQVTEPTPVGPGDHIEVANVEFRVEFREQPPRIPPSLLEVLKKTTQAIDVIQTDWVLSQFDELMRTGNVIPHFQPVVQLDGATIIGSEALARTTLSGLESPAEMFATAELCHREVELSVLCRQRAFEASEWFPENHSLFVNTHPSESVFIDLIPSVANLTQDYPDVPLVVEIHEGAIEDPGMMAECIQELRKLGARVAYDDFGAGQSRLLELVKYPPDYLKFDRSLIQGIHQANLYHWRMLQLLVQSCRENNIITIAEGIELEEEADCCRELGFHLAQGFYFGLPEPGPDVDIASMENDRICSDTNRISFGRD